MISMTFAAVICDTDDRYSVNRSLNRLSRYLLQVHLDLNTSDVSSLVQHSSDDRDPSMMQNVLSHSGFHAKFFQVSVILSPLILQLHVPSWSAAVNYFFFLQSDLLEFSVEFLPYVVSWIPLRPLMHVIFDLGSSFLLQEIPCLLSVLLQGTAGTVGTSNFFRSYLMNSLNSVSQDQWSNFFSVLLHYRASVFHLSKFAFPSFSSSLTYFSRFLPTNDEILGLRVVSLVVLRMYLSGGFSFNKVKCVRTVQENPTNHRCVFSCILYEYSWRRQHISVEWEMILLSTRRVWLLNQRDDRMWSLPK